MSLGFLTPRTFLCLYIRGTPRHVALACACVLSLSWLSLSLLRGALSPRVFSLSLSFARHASLSLNACLGLSRLLSLLGPLLSLDPSPPFIGVAAVEPACRLQAPSPCRHLAVDLPGDLPAASATPLRPRPRGCPNCRCAPACMLDCTFSCSIGCRLRAPDRPLRALLRSRPARRLGCTSRRTLGFGPPSFPSSLSLLVPLFPPATLLETVRR